jgi:hypothetical protein
LITCVSDGICRWSATVVGQLHRAVGAEGDGLVQGTDGGFGTHGHRDDLLDRDRPTLLDLHRSLEGVRVEGVEVFLTAAVETHRAGIDALLYSGVRYLLDQDADLQVKPPWGTVLGKRAPGLTCAIEAASRAGMLSSQTVD